MLKVATEPQESFGVLMAWWDGNGAARVLAMHRDAILLERARGQRSLAGRARDGRDDEATRIICDVVARLHAPSTRPLPDLDFGARGRLAIDPKRLQGVRGFDDANPFCNPDLADPSRPVAAFPDRFARRLEILVERSDIDRRLLQWILAWAGLSAAWLIADGRSPRPRIAALALAEING